MHRFLATADAPWSEANENLQTNAHPWQLSRLIRVPVNGAPAQSATDLSRLVQEIRRLLRAVTPPDLSLRFQLADSLPPVRVDEVRLRQMLTHLVAAVGCQATAQQWPLTIRTRAVPAPQPGEVESPALELLLGSDSDSALALLRWAVISQGRGRTGNMLPAATLQQNVHELHCSVNFSRLPGQGSLAQLLFLS